VVVVDVFFGQVVHYICWFGGGEQRDDCAIAEEAQVTVICHDLDWVDPGEAGFIGSAGAGVVDCADVAPVEAYSRAVTELAAIGWIDFGC